MRSHSLLDQHGAGIEEKIALIFLPGLTADHRLFEKQIEFFEEEI